MTATSPDPTAVSLSPRVDTERPLSRTQSLIWASQRLAPSTPLANMGKVHRFAGSIDPARLVEAFEHVVASSDALRTVVAEPPGKPPTARVLARPPATTALLDLPLAELDAWCDRRIATPIDATAAGYDSVLIRHADDDWTWWLDLHHIVTDAFASALVFERTAETYAALRAGSELPSFAETGFYDHVAAQIDRAADERRPERLAFWTEQPVDDRPIAPYGPTAPRTSRTERLPLVLDRDLDAAIGDRYRTLSRELSLLTVASMTTAATIHRLDGRSGVTLGIPIHHRSGPVASTVIGPLMELYPLRIDLDVDETFAELFDRVYRSIVAVLRNARVGESPDARFDAVVNVLTARFGDFAGTPTETRWARSGHVDPNHSLRVQVYDYGDGLRLELDVNAALSGDGSHARLPAHLGATIDAAVADPDRPFGDAVSPLADEIELMAALNPPAPTGPELRPVHDVVAERLRGDPTAVTAEQGPDRLTAGDLDAAADALARHLITDGAVPGARIGIRMRRSLDVLVAIHGVLRAGGAFVMLDPDDPSSRHDAIAEDAALHRILDRLPDTGADAGQPAQPAQPSPSVPVDLDDLAYVLYTSGSTGTPKGVPISHRGLADYLRFAEQSYTPGRPAIMPLHSSLVFDLTITSLFLPQLTGGRTIVIDGDPLSTLASVAAQRELTVLKATPSQLELLTRMIDEPLPLDVVIVGGEAFRRPVAAAFADRCRPGLRTFNEYGPTEAVVGCMIHEWDRDRDTGPDVPIGTASPGAEVHVLDEGGRPTPVGAWGELYVRRAGMATGYLNLPELSAERFAAVPAVGGGPLYRTGDRVRMTGGVLVYGGRNDDQLQFNGVRLEPGEIEAALVRHPSITNAAVRVWVPGDAHVDRCLRCGLGTDVPEIAIDADGVCTVCRQFESVEPQTRSWFRNADDLERIREDAAARAGGDYDCLHLLSGGKDSTYALYQLVERGWRVHALTLDNGFISDGAKANIARSIDDLGISHEFVTTEAMNEIFRDSLDRFANVCNGCYKTIYTLATARAHELSIPVIVTGLSRGQFFETRLVPHQFEAGRFDPDAIDRTVLQARRAYHRTADAVTESLPEQRVFERGDLDVLDEIAYVDFYRYVDVELAEMYDFLERRAPWVRPDDTGRSTNCLVNVAGIHVHRTERGYHNYAEPYSWDVRLGHKTRDEALDELDDEIDLAEVERMLDEIGYRPKSPELLTAWYQTVDDEPIDHALLRSHLRDLLPARSVPAAYVHVDDLPLADSAKLDTAALPAPARLQAGSTEYLEPSTPTEAIAARVWARVLDVDRVGLDDDFFDLGGSSLPALEAIAAMEAELGVDLPDALVFGHRVLREFATAADAEIERNASAGQAITGEIAPLDDDRRPVSPGEAAMLFEYRSNPSDTRYNVTRLYTVDEALDLERVRSAIETVVARHQPLHTALDPQRTVLPVGQACSVAPMPPGSADEFADRQRRVPFDLDRGPLVRVHVGRDDDATHLLIGMHHLSVDAGTFDTFWDEVDLAYHGHELAPLPTTVAAHGEWQRGRWSEARSFWAETADRSEHSGDATPPAPLAPEADGYVEVETALRVDELVAGSATTPFAASLAAAAVVLAAHSRTGTVELGITASTKDHPDVDPLVGYFLNTLPIRLDVDPAAPLRHVDRRAGELVAAALPHRSLPLAEIVEQARRADRVPPDVSHMLAYERLAPASWGSGTARHRILASGTSVSDLTFFVQERGDELRLGLEYRGTVMGRADAVRLLGAFDAALSSIATRSHRPAAELMAALAGDDLTGPAVEVGQPSILHHIAERAASTPTDRAVIGPDGETLTYAELWERAGAIAERVGDAIVRPRRVGVAVSRSAHMVTAIVGAMASGAAYVALDPSTPDRRLDRIVEQAGLDAVIVDGSTRGRYPGLPEIDLAAETVASSPGAIRMPDPDDIAYVIFTSGSTGTPAGVAVSHRNLAASTAARPAFYGDRKPERFLLTSSIGFDSSIVGLFWPLATGGTVVVPSDAVVHDVDRLADLIAAESISHTLMVPSLYRAMLDRRPGKLTSLECAIVAGEACSAALVATHHRLLPHVELVNEYGPTEATVWATAHRCDHDDPVPIGGPIPGVTVRVADDHLGRIAHGAPGELLIAGPGVTGGYLGGRSSDAFVRIDDRIWYRTGDVVRDRGDGTLVFLGRADDQLNVGGVRVEPGELEAHLTDLDGVADAVVVATMIADRDTLVAHLEGDRDRIDPIAVRRHLGDRVLAGAIPRVIEVHDTLPRTPHGKIDRRAAASLPTAESTQPTAPASAETIAAGDVAAIVDIWQTALRNPTLDGDADFFAHGGDSLAAVEVVTRLAELAGRDVPVAALLESPTPTAMTAALDLDERDPDVGVRMITMRPGRAGGPLVVLTAAWDDIQGYRALADGLPDDVTAIAPAVVRRDGSFDTVDVVVDDVLRQLDDEALSRRPLAVVGWSIGGVVAFELGQRLAAAGVDVATIAMVDTYFPGEQRHLWANRWSKYKSMLNPESIGSAANELRKSARNRTRRYAARAGHTILRWAGESVPAPESERATPGGIPFAAMDHSPTLGDVPVTLYAALTTNPERTIVPWRRVSPDLRVVELDGRHRGADSIMSPERVHHIVDDLLGQIR